MKIAFVGKGGSGKTTLAALFARYLAAAGSPVLALDADINQHLAVALGHPEDQAAELPALGDRLTEIKEHLRGANPRIASVEVMVKTTPPGRGSRLLRISGADPLYDRLTTDIDGVRLGVAGPFSADQVGVACYHGKVGAVELLLNHTVDGQGEYLVVDMTAGADSFASGLFTRFDHTFLVCEPTLRSVGVYRQYVGHAREFGVRVSVVGNKVSDDDDVTFLREHVGDDLLGWLSASAYVRAAERGRPRPVTALEPANTTTLRRLREAVDATAKDWPRFTRQATEFHLRNARAWADARTGVDLAEQVDPEFVLGPEALAAAELSPLVDAPR